MSAIHDVLKDLAKKNPTRVGAPGTVTDDITWLSTGNLAIDYVAGGGLPLGRSVELFGPPSSGKSTAAIQAAARLQADILAGNRDEHIIFLDFERTFDTEYAQNLGVDTDHDSFLLARPRTMEHGCEVALKLIETGQVRLAIFDSVAAMAPLARLDGDFDQRTAAMNKARLMAGLMLQLTPLLDVNDTCGAFVNHEYESVEMTGRPGLPPKTTTPGGKALKYYASLRLQFAPIGATKTKGIDLFSGDAVHQAVASVIKVKSVKNKLAAPNRTAECRITYGEGFDNTWTALQVLHTHKRIVKSGAWFYFDAAKVPTLQHPDLATSGTGRPAIQGESSVLRFASEHPDWAAAMGTLAAEVIHTHGAAAPTTDDEDDE